MDPRDNPYTPNAAARPPALVGRQQELDSFEILLHRLRRGYTEQSMIITGLRGVGKTVLLGEFRQRALDVGWVVVEIEVAKHDDAHFRTVLAREFRRALFTLSPKAKWSDKARKAAGVLKSFSLTVRPDGTLAAGLDVDAVEGQGDSGELGADLTDLFVATGEAAADHQTGIVLLLDEVQFLDRAQLEAVIAGVHRTVQRALPVTMTAAGLPQIAELAGAAKSYAERLFKFPSIGTLADTQAKAVLTVPAEDLGVSVSPEALDVALAFTDGYPYFLQEFGQAIWNIADGDTITGDDAELARLVVQEKLDSGFFGVRLDRTTALEEAYLRAMADLGPEPQRAADVAGLLDRTSEQCGPIRSNLVQKGLLYTPGHGYAAFTVPQFDVYLKRAIPELVVPPIRTRARSDS